MQRTLFTLLVLSPTSLLADDANAVSDRIAPFLEERTILVGHVDVERFDVEAVLRFLITSLPEPEYPETNDPPLERPAARAARERTVAVKEALVAAGAGNLYLLYGWDDLPDRRPVIVVPVARADAVGAISRFLPQRRGHVVEYFRGAVVVGDEASAARLRGAKPARRPDLLAALAATGDAAARLVIASPAEERRVIRAMLPDRLPEPLGTRYRSLFTEAEWFALYGDPPPTLRGRFVTAMPNAAGAEAMQVFQREGLAALAKWPAAMDEVPNIERIAALPKITVEGSRVVLSLTDEAEVRAVVEALQPNLVATFGGLVRSGRIEMMKQLGLAMHNFHDTYQALPPRAILSKEGAPLLSWRVAILPQLDQLELYRRFHLDEPWDSEHNKPLLAEMPEIYDARSGEAGMTTYVVPVAEGAMFDGPAGTPFSEVKDGLSNTVMIVDVGDELAVPWTKPADWEIDWDQPLKGVVQPGTRGFLVTLGDGSIHTFPADVATDRLKAYVSRAGGEVISPE